MAASKNRPFSAESRMAWGGPDDGGVVNPSGTQFDDDDMMPSAMESEIYKKKNQTMAVPGKVGGHVQQTTNKQSLGCWGNFKKGVRSLWATRQTEATKDNRELHIKTTLRELITYCVFLIILCILTFGMTSSTMYYYTNVLNTLFINTPGDSSNPGSNYNGINLQSDWFDYVQNVLIMGLFGNWEKWYNGRNMTDEDLGYIYYENKIQGVPRIRQLRVRNDSCVIPSDFQEQIKLCYGQYSEGAEDKTPFGLMNGTAWKYQSSKQLKGSSYWGQVSTYGGGGYVQDLQMSSASSSELVEALKGNLWLDRGTRAVFVDFTVYNANINLFCVIKLVTEYPATGGAIPSYSFRTVKLIRYVSPMDFFVLACECIFCLFIVYYCVEEILEIRRLRCAYLKEFWNILDLIVIAISICCIAFNIYRTVAVSKILDSLLVDAETYCDFDFISYWQIVFNSALAIMVFFAWIKIFKYISFNKTMTQLSTTLGACAKDLLGFAVMFFIVFLAFAQLGYLIFGTQVQDFSSFETSIFTLFRIILGDFNFQALQQANRVLGPAFFILYVFFVFFVLLNMFLAIINDTYSEVKADLATQKNEFEMGDYFREGYQKVLSKLHLKRNKIIEIQKALQSADSNGDRVIDFEEWRHDLKMRGYAEAEIEAVFAKYDLDGDRALDEDELRKMQADLEGQRLAISQEYDDYEKTTYHQKSHGGSGGAGGGVGVGGAVAVGYDSDDDDKAGNGVSGGAVVVNGVSQEEFTLLQRRVDRMEHSIGSIVSKIDAVLVKLEAMERAKAKRRETMAKLLDSITESDGTTDEMKRQTMERLVRDEMEKWDTETSFASHSPNASAIGGRIQSGANAALAADLPSHRSSSP